MNVNKQNQFVDDKSRKCETKWLWVNILNQMSSKKGTDSMWQTEKQNASILVLYILWWHPFCECFFYHLNFKQKLVDFRYFLNINCWKKKQWMYHSLWQTDMHLTIDYNIWSKKIVMIFTGTYVEKFISFWLKQFQPSTCFIFNGSTS